MTSLPAGCCRCLAANCLGIYYSYMGYTRLITFMVLGVSFQPVEESSLMTEIVRFCTKQPTCQRATEPSTTKFLLSQMKQMKFWSMVSMSRFLRRK